MLDLIIIGAGPAGMSACLYASRAGLDVLILDGSAPGGKLNVTAQIENYPGLKPTPGPEIAFTMYESAMSFGAKMAYEEALDIKDHGDYKEVITAKQTYQAKYVLIATGTKERQMNLEKENELVGRGISYCAVCDGPFFKNQEVAVIGGGNVAIDVARDSKRCASDDTKVNMFCLESRETMPASVEEIEEAESEGIVVNPGWGPKEVLVDENGEVRGVVLKKCLSVFDAEGRFNPTYDESELMTVECKHVFFSVGQSIVWGDLLKGSKVELGRGNGAVADELTYQTAEPDIFVGGDVYTGPKFAIDAIAAGKQGAISIHRFVQPQSSLTIGRNRNDFIELDKNDIKVENYDNSSRQIPGHNDAIDTKHSFRDAKLLFTEEQVKAETARCLGCGASVVDPNKCIGCGLCTTKCEFDAIKLHRELPECSRMVPYEDRLKFVLPNMVKQSIKLKFKKK